MIVPGTVNYRGTTIEEEVGGGITTFIINNKTVKGPRFPDLQRNVITEDGSFPDINLHHFIIVTIIGKRIEMTRGAKRTRGEVGRGNRPLSR